MIPTLSVGGLGMAIRAAIGGGGSGVTWNPSDKDAALTLSTGNQVVQKTGAGGSWTAVRATAGRTSGYFEVLVGRTGGGDAMIGLTSIGNSLADYPGGSGGGRGYYWFNGHKYIGGVDTAYGATYANGDVIGVSYDGGAGTVEFFKNNVSQGVAFSSVSGTLYPCVAIYPGGSADTLTGRFNSTDQAYAPPSGVPRWDP